MSLPLEISCTVNDICVIQGGGRASFLEKAPLMLGVGGFVARQDLNLWLNLNRVAAGSPPLPAP